MSIGLNIALQKGQDGVAGTPGQAIGRFWKELIGYTPQILAALTAFLAFLIVGFIVRAVLKTTLRRVAMAPRIRILVVRLVFVFILALGAIVFLATITNASIGRIVTGFGLLSVALGFALKSPLENMISGVITILVAPFRIGDEIEVSGYTGRVETINIHDTILHTFDGKKVAIPNVEVYLNAIVNQTAYSRRRYDVLIGIHYNDDLPRAMEVAREVLASVEGVTIPFPIRTLHLPEDGEKSTGTLQIKTNGSQESNRNLAGQNSRRSEHDA
ncbi:MAG: mechanosensitive ion channel family protein [Rubrobacteraceae bacterium]